MNNQKYMVFDYETFSTCDLNKAGAYEYALHPSTEILCVAYRIGTRKTLANTQTQLLIKSDWDCRAIDTGFVRALNNPKIKLVAHNAFFERVITQHVLSRTKNLLGSGMVIDPKRWCCSAAMARTAGLPGGLDGASVALGLKHTKDKAGHAVMLKLSKPKKPTDKDPRERYQDPEDLKKLYAYCVSDIDAEVELFLKLPLLTKLEQEFWALDIETNLRGFLVDRRLVRGALSCIGRETETHDSKISRLTDGAINSARQTKAVGLYLKSKGLKLKNLKAPTVEDALKDASIDPHCRSVLELRQAASKSSTAKFVAFEKRSRTDGRARDNTIFYGAHTGRQAGTGLNPQNLFKTVIPASELAPAIELVHNRDLTAIQALFDRPMDVFASVLRSAIIAPAGSVLDVGDFATIEVRVLFWLSGHQAGLDALASGRDIYLDMASKIHNMPLEDLTTAYNLGEDWALKARQLGKQDVLGAGFGIGIGGHKFQATAKTYGIDISLSLAAQSIRAYRKLHQPVPRFWDVIETAAIKALKNPGKSFTHGRLTWRKEGRWLTCQLPIGRKLFYYRPRMQWEQSPAGLNLVLTYVSVNSVSRKFERVSTWGGKLTENVVQAVSRDLLYEALKRLRGHGHQPVLAVHDEIICERALDPDDPVAVDDEMLRLMEVVPDWAAGLPVKVEGWSEDRYRK